MPKALQDIESNVNLFGQPGNHVSDLSDKLEQVLEHAKDQLTDTARLLGGTLL